jgi:hypothetical protein
MFRLLWIVEEQILGYFKMGWAERMDEARYLDCTRLRVYIARKTPLVWRIQFSCVQQNLRQSPAYLHKILSRVVNLLDLTN